MKCLSREQLQAYIDNELDFVVQSNFQKHISNCVKCSSALEQAQKNIILIKSELNSINQLLGDIEIPEFNKPKNAKSLQRFWPYVAAACIAILFLFTPITKRYKSIPIPQSELMIEMYYENADLNQLWHDKESSIILEDENGNVIYISTI